MTEKGDHDAAIHWFDKALQVNPQDRQALRQKGVALARKGDQDAAIQWYDKALEVNAKDYHALRNKGVALAKKRDQDAAIQCFDKALQVNPQDYHALREKAVALAEKGDQDAAIQWFDKALQVNPQDYHALRNKGVSLSNKGDQDAAGRWFDKALEANPADARSQREWSVLEFNRGSLEEAFRRISEALKLAPDEFADDFVYVCRATGHDPAEEWESLLPDTPYPKAEEPLSELQQFILSIRQGFEQDTDDFLNKQRQDEERRREFLTPVSLLDPERSLLMVLRKWNSFTPALPSAEDERSRGGGYFIWHRGKGIVIDPGYNFIENFYDAGCRICDIDAVILTHAHNDHTIDFETLRALLHEFNDGLKAGTAKKEVDFYLSNGAFLKFSGMIDLQDTDYTGHVFTLNPGGRFTLPGRIELRVVPAYHDEVVARDQAVGLDFRVPVGKGSRRLLFTADTGLFPLEKGTRRQVPDTDGDEVWKEYGVTKRNYPDLMVVHIGAIRDTELKMDLDLDPKEACYPNHLGIIGTARVVTQCLPRIAVISEFGEEMRQFRCPLVRGLQQNVINKFLDPDQVPHIPRVVPGDLPFIYDIQTHGVYCCVSQDWVNADDIEFAGEGEDDEPRQPREGEHDQRQRKDLEKAVFYFASGKRGDFTDDEGRWTWLFRHDREGRRSLYFRQCAP